MRENDPATYCRIIASLLPKEVAIQRPLEGLSDDQLLDAIAVLQGMVNGAVIEGEAVASPQQATANVQSDREIE